MDAKNELKRIKKGDYRPIYILYGTEKYPMQAFISELIHELIPQEHRNVAITKYDLNETNVEFVIEDAGTLPFLVPKKVIVAENASFLTGAREQKKIEHDINSVQEYIKNPADFSVLLFTVNAEKLDERKKIVKLLKKEAGVFAFLPLKDHDLSEWVLELADKHQCQFEEGSMEQLILYTGGNLQTISTEMEKLSLFAGKDGFISKQMVEELVTRSVEQNVFVLIDYTVTKRAEKALELLKELLKQKEEPIKILNLIARQFRIILLTKKLNYDGYSQRQIATQIGIHPYGVKIALQQSKGYEQKKLLQILSELADLDYQMKSGKINKQLGLELFLLKLAS